MTNGEGIILEVPVAVGRQGLTFLLAQSADIHNDNRNGPAQTHSILTKEVSAIFSLQVFFKWGQWLSCTNEEYLQAKQAIPQ